MYRPISRPVSKPEHRSLGGWKRSLELQSITKIGVPVDTVITTPIMTFPEDVISTDTVAVEAGLEFSLDEGDTWLSVTTVVGTATTVRFRLTSSSSYETEVSLDATVDSIVYTISVTTAAEFFASNAVIFDTDTDVWFDADGNVIFGAA